ncbi:MAG: hypothetical protein BMS9Abin07_1100 [Acidimicrobiia bacterium]|nr:MAG: hypothetical protein BMS9Abin07_1100 [Acidimicrobiia bacterium]
MTLREAATACLVRDARLGPEVLMVRRSDRASFMGGAWVFPGGAVDDGDAGPDALAAVRSSDDDLFRWLAAALRELVEETGIWLTVNGVTVTAKRPYGLEVFGAAPAPFDGDALRYFANWITPAPLPIRFDTRFFVTEVPPRVEALVDGKELVEAAWIAPAEAIERAESGGWLVAFPTRKTLWTLSGHETAAKLIAELTVVEVASVQPRLAVGEDWVRILLPGEEGFDEAGDGEHDPDLLTRALAIAAAGGDVPAEMHGA